MNLDTDQALDLLLRYGSTLPVVKKTEEKIDRFYASLVLRKPLEFVKNLSEKEKSFLRGLVGHELLLPDQEKDIDTIFNRIPSLERPLIVHRTASRNNVRRASPEIIAAFVTLPYQQKDCCLLRITLPIGSRVIPLDDNEVLLPRRAQLLLTATTVISEKPRVEVFDVVFIPPGSVDITDAPKKMTVDEWSLFLFNQYYHGVSDVNDTHSLYPHAPNEAIDRAYAKYKFMKKVDEVKDGLRLKGKAITVEELKRMPAYRKISPEKMEKIIEEILTSNDEEIKVKLTVK